MICISNGLFDSRSELLGLLEDMLIDYYLWNMILLLSSLSYEFLMSETPVNDGFLIEIG